MNITASVNIVAGKRSVLHKEDVNELHKVEDDEKEQVARKIQLASRNAV